MKKKELKMIRKRINGKLPAVRIEIEDIIARESQSQGRIMDLLDRLHTWAYFGAGAKEFDELNGYLRTINPTEAGIYACWRKKKGVYGEK